jgi:hypothetical protein
MSVALHRPRSPVIGVVLLSAIILLIAGLVFLGIYWADGDHFGALQWIGSVSLFFAVVCYLAQSLSSDPSVQRAIGWGFLAMGFTLLFGTDLLNPSISSGGRLVGAILLLVLLAVAIGGVVWRMRTADSDRTRQRLRDDWAGRPAPNAFDYATVTPAAMPPASNSAPPPYPPPPGGM